MTVKMITSLVGHGWALTAGDTHECSDAEGQRLIAAGHAVPVKGKPLRTATIPDDPATETAAIDESPVETAAADPAPRKMKGKPQER